MNTQTVIQIHYFIHIILFYYVQSHTSIFLSPLLAPAFIMILKYYSEVDRSVGPARMFFGNYHNIMRDNHIYIYKQNIIKCVRACSWKRSPCNNVKYWWRQQHISDQQKRCTRCTIILYNIIRNNEYTPTHTYDSTTVTQTRCCCTLYKTVK